MQKINTAPVPAFICYSSSTITVKPDGTLTIQVSRWQRGCRIKEKNPVLGSGKAALPGRVFLFYGPLCTPKGFDLTIALTANDYPDN